MLRRTCSKEIAADSQERNRLVGRVEIAKSWTFASKARRLNECCRSQSSEGTTPVKNCSLAGSAAGDLRLDEPDSVVMTIAPV